MAEVFLHIIESGLRGGNTRFAVRTFAFLRVCKCWNEVADSSPQLWVWWIPGAVKAWPLFCSRSKDTPLLLTWRSRLPAPARDILMDPTIPRRIRRLDFSGTSEQLMEFLGAFNPSPTSNVSSVRLQIFPYDDHEPKRTHRSFPLFVFPKTLTT